MATYHLHAEPVSRSQGRSATAAAAYRSGTKIADLRTGKVFDFKRKKGVLHTELIMPGGGSADRSEFWNKVEAHHKRGDAVVSREVEVSLPRELTPAQRQQLAVGFATELAERYGVAADVCLHEPRTVTDRDLEKKPNTYWEIDPATGRRHNGNWHAHIMLSACHVQPDGTLGKKAVELDPIHCNRAKIMNLTDRERPRWSELANAALEQYGHEVRIDHRSHKERGIDDEPSQHLGPAASAIERRTGQPSRKRLDHDQGVTERLLAAKQAGELEREGQTVEQSILDLSGDLNAARADRDRMQRDLPQRIELGMSSIDDKFAQWEAAQRAKEERQRQEQQQREEQERQQKADRLRQLQTEIDLRQGSGPGKSSDPDRGYSR